MWSVEGDQFWNVSAVASRHLLIAGAAQVVGKSVPSALITLAQWSFLPLQLCPNMMNANDVKEGQTDFRTTISIAVSGSIDAFERSGLALSLR